MVAQPRLRSDIRCMLQLTVPRAPPEERYRAGSTSVAYYMPRDASGKGFGSALIGPDRTTYHAGTWAKEWRDESSNFRETDNLVLKVKDLHLVQEGTLRDQELFLFTDNWVFEDCYYKGHSASKELSDIILRLYLAQRNSHPRLHVTHVAGTRMKALGVDDLSRGDYLEGFLALHDPMALVPLSKGALSRDGSQRLQAWLDGWWDGWQGTALPFLTPVWKRSWTYSTRTDWHTHGPHACSSSLGS